MEAIITQKRKTSPNYIDAVSRDTNTRYKELSTAMADQEY